MGAWEDFMVQFGPYIFVLIGVVVAYMLYQIFSGSDLRIFLLLNAIIQFVVAGATQNGACVIVAVLSLLPVVLARVREAKSGGTTDGE